MDVAIMQPYLFPYIGYFQLMNACDVFVVHDDVQYIKGGWINRNRIRLGESAHWLTFPVVHASYELPINERQYIASPTNVRRLLRRIQAAYRTAPYFDETFPLIEEIFRCETPNVALFNTRGLRRLAAWLELSGRIVLSSSIEKPNQLRGPARVIDLCHRVGASRYVNPMGGVAVYDPEAFAERGIELRFLRVLPACLSSAPPFMSIIDTLMLYGQRRTIEMAGEFALVTHREAITLV